MSGIKPHIIHPGIFPSDVIAFFTGRNPGIERAGISDISSISRERIFFPIQEHTAKVQEVGKSLKPEVADAALTGRSGVLLGVGVADCVPILVYSPSLGIIGAVHAGWRGTAAGLLKTALKLMTGPEGCKDLLVAIGPAIRWCCYEVQKDVLDRVIMQTGDGDYHKTRNGRICLDLPGANKHQAVSIGVPESNIWVSEECTYCYPDKYYSYRYEKGQKGRQGGFIGLREQ